MLVNNDWKYAVVKKKKKKKKKGTRMSKILGKIIDCIFPFTIISLFTEKRYESETNTI